MTPPIAPNKTAISLTNFDLQFRSVRLKRLPPEFDGFRIGVISDLHLGPYTGVAEVEFLVQTLAAQDLDMAVALGDFIHEPIIRKKRRAREHAALCAAALAGLKSRYGTYAVLGNHDLRTDAAVVSDALIGSGIRVLCNSSEAIELDGARLWIAGIDDALEGNPKLDWALAGVPESGPTILLAHEPDFADRACRYPIDLQLSGHTHGGQCRLPGCKPFYLPELGRKYPAGFYDVNSLKLYTSRGVGMSVLPLRWQCPPEIAVLTLRSPALSSHLNDTRILAEEGHSLPQ